MKVSEIEGGVVTLRKLTMSISMTMRGLSMRWTTPLRTGMLALTTWATTTPLGWWKSPTRVLDCT